MFTIKQFAIDTMKREIVVTDLKKIPLEYVLMDTFKSAFINAFNVSVHQEPELVITLEELESFIAEAHGLASRELAS